MNSHNSVRRMLLAALATRILFTFTQAVPLSYATYDGNDLIPEERPEIVLLLNQRIPEIQNIYPDRDPTFRLERSKRIGTLSKIGSLSIANSLDVLRNRVLLEMARRKAQQDQRQIDANRRLLESIGKRSIPESFPRGLKAQKEEEHEERSTNSADKIQHRTQNWFDGNDPVFQHDEKTETNRVQDNEPPLL